MSVELYLTNPLFNLFCVYDKYQSITFFNKFIKKITWYMMTFTYLFVEYCAFRRVDIAWRYDTPPSVLTVQLLNITFNWNINFHEFTTHCDQTIQLSSWTQLIYFRIKSEPPTLFFYNLHKSTNTVFYHWGIVQMIIFQVIHNKLKKNCFDFHGEVAINCIKSCIKG